MWCADIVHARVRRRISCQTSRPQGWNKRSLSWHVSCIGTGAHGARSWGNNQIRGSSNRVLVYLTPGTLRGSRRPRECDRVLICGHGAESAPPLPESGGTVVFTGARHAVEPGKRFGVWIRVVHLPSGVASEELYLDLTRTSDGNPQPAEESRQDDDATSNASVDSSRPSTSSSTP